MVVLIVALVVAYYVIKIIEPIAMILILVIANFFLNKK